MLNAYTKTIEKLDSITETLHKCIQNGDLDLAESTLALLRGYSECFYCVDYRKSLTEDKPGVCDGCPCHKLGTELLGRNRSYNGCYISGPYRDLVRDSLWFITDKSITTINACLRSIVKLKQYMNDHRAVLDG